MAGAQCCGETGTVVEFGGLKTYITGPSDSKLAVLLVSDIYGYEAPNLRKLADKVGAAGFYVVVPDFFYGDPYVPGKTEKPFPVWTKSHGTDKGFEDAKPVIAALKHKGISAIGAAGFSWGAKVVVELAKSDHIQAVVLLRPPFDPEDDLKEVKINYCVLCAEIHKISPTELFSQFKLVLLDDLRSKAASGDAKLKLDRFTK